MTLKEYEARPTEMNGKMTADQIAAYKLQIDSMDQYQMCSLHRFHKSGDPSCPWFDTHNPTLVAYWSKRFHELGGMTPEISKALGW